ncbi:MAG: hypothetical protein IPH08_03770 [Rhodocyclaceae bacterium]|nr:hypothetical protein [Rhodocyclaceae bacterium]
MGRRPQRPAEERELWVTLYYGGLTIEEIAERADVGKQVVHHALKGEGVVFRPRGRRKGHKYGVREPISQSEREAVLTMRTGGFTMTDIAIRLSLPLAIVRDECKRMGLAGRM